MERRAGGFVHGSMFLVDSNVFAREVGNGLYMEPGVKVLEWEEGKSKGEKTKRREKGGKEGRR